MQIITLYPPEFSREICYLKGCVNKNRHIQVSYVCSSVLSNSTLKKSNEMQQCVDIYLLLNYCTCFGRPSCPSSGVHKSVVAASGTDHTVRYKG